MPEFWQKLDSQNKIYAKKLVKNVFFSLLCFFFAINSKITKRSN